MASLIQIHLPPVHQLPPQTAIVHETAHQRKLVADLAQIRPFLQPNMNDKTSNLIRKWHENFTAGLRKKRTVQNGGESDEDRFNRILNTHLDQMRELLRDPLTNTPLDREAVLGSDGETYGFKSLCLAVSRLPAQYAHNSPLHPNLAAPFTKKPHLLARHMVSFLAEWGPLDQSHALEQEFDTYFQNHPLPVIPETPVAVPVNLAPAQPVQALPQQNQPAALGPRPPIMTFSRLWAEDAVAGGAAAHPPAQRGHSNIMTMNDLWAQDAQDDAFIPLVLAVPPEAPPAAAGFNEADLANLLGIIDEQEQFEAEEAQHQAEADAAFAQNLNEMVDAALEEFQQEFAPLHEQRAAFAAEIAAAIHEYQAQNDADIAELQNEIDGLNQEIAVVNAAIAQLPPHIHTLQHEILEAKKEDLELERDIKQLSVAVKEKKKSGLDALGALVIGGLCVVLTVLTSSLAAYWLPNSVTAVFPMGSGTGAQFATRIFI